MECLHLRIIGQETRAQRLISWVRRLPGRWGGVEKFVPSKVCFPWVSKGGNLGCPRPWGGGVQKSVPKKLVLIFRPLNNVTPSSSSVSNLSAALSFKNMAQRNYTNRKFSQLKNHKAARRRDSRDEYPADIRGGHSGRPPWLKALVRPSKPWKATHLGADIHDPNARWSMTSRGPQSGGSGCLEEGRLGLPGQVWELRFLPSFPSFPRGNRSSCLGSLPGFLEVPDHSSTRHLRSAYSKNLVQKFESPLVYFYSKNRENSDHGLSFPSPETQTMV